MSEPEAADADEPPQLVLTRRLVELSVERTRLAELRTELSKERTRQATVRTTESKVRTELSEGRTRESKLRTEQAKLRTKESELRTELSRERSRQSVERTRQSRLRTGESELRTRESKVRTAESEERTRQSVLRTELSAGRSYMNAERTLSVWVRTALAVMVVGIAIDRFGLTLSEHTAAGPAPDSAADWIGAALVVFGVVIAVVTAVRFGRYSVAYRREHTVPQHHGPYMAPMFALLTALFGVVLLVLLFASL